MNRSENIKSLVGLREEVIEAIRNEEIEPVKIAYEAGVSVATVYNFLKGKAFNTKIIEWYLARR